MLYRCLLYLRGSLYIRPWILRVFTHVASSYANLWEQKKGFTWDVMWKRSFERFPTRGRYLCKFIRTEESVFIRKEFHSKGFVWNTNMGAISLFFIENAIYVEDTMNWPTCTNWIKMKSLLNAKRFSTLRDVCLIDMIIVAMIIVTFKLCQARSQDYLRGYHAFGRLWWYDRVYFYDLLIFIEAILEGG